MKHPVPHKAQSTTYNCGPTCLEMLLDFYGISYDPQQIDKLCDAAPGRGTENDKLVEAAAHLGFKPVVRRGATLDDIIAAIEAGHPVVVNYFNCRSNVGHYAIVKGMDLGARTLFLADPKNGDDYPLTFDHFQKHWHNHEKTIRAWMMYAMIR